MPFICLARSTTCEGRGVATELSPHLLKELDEVDIRLLKRASECETIYLIMKGEHNPSSVRMFHLDVATLAVNLHEAKPSQGGEHFPTGEQG